MKRWTAVFYHLTVILGLFVGTMWVLDQFNPLMGFLDNTAVNLSIFLLCLSGIASGITGIRDRCAYGVRSGKKPENDEKKGGGRYDDGKCTLPEGISAG